jgi:hypothetical protein
MERVLRESKQSTKINCKETLKNMARRKEEQKQPIGVGLTTVK